jgi:hypothetical protein
MPPTAINNDKAQLAFWAGIAALSLPQINKAIAAGAAPTASSLGGSALCKLCHQSPQKRRSVPASKAAICEIIDRLVSLGASPLTDTSLANAINSDDWTTFPLLRACIKYDCKDDAGNSVLFVLCSMLADDEYRALLALSTALFLGASPLAKNTKGQLCLEALWSSGSAMVENIKLTQKAKNASFSIFHGEVMWKATSILLSGGATLLERASTGEPLHAFIATSSRELGLTGLFPQQEQMLASFSAMAVLEVNVTRAIITAEAPTRVRL